MNITIFEKDGRIGGRTLTVPAYGDGELVELGASIFIELNHILFNATQEFGLNATKPNPGDDIDRGLGIWDGDEFVFTMKERDSWWWNIGRLFWKYGIAPYRTQKLMESTIASFLEIYNRPNFPFKSLTETAMNLGLTAFTGVTGAQLLQLNNVSFLSPYEPINLPGPVGSMLNRSCPRLAKNTVMILSKPVPA